MSDFERYEYVIKPAKDKKTVLGRVLLIIGYVFFVIDWIAFGLSTKIFWPLLALIPLSLWILIFFTRRYVNVEYEYSIESGIITFSNIYGGRSRKKVMIFDIRDAERSLPLSGESTCRAVEDFGAEKEFYFAAGNDVEGSMVALCVDDDNNRLAIAFTADEKLRKLLLMYNRRAML